MATKSTSTEPTGTSEATGTAGPPADTETKGATFQEAAEAGTFTATDGAIGYSPERERTGRRDKGLSQANPAIMQGGPVPDARSGVDDSEALAALADLPTD